MCETAHKKKGYHLIKHDMLKSLPLYYFFFGLRASWPVSHRGFPWGVCKIAIWDHLKGMDQRPPRDHTDESSLIGYWHRADVFPEHEVSNHGNLFAPVGRVDR